MSAKLDTMVRELSLGERMKFELIPRCCMRRRSSFSTSPRSDST
jgi:hypothetical protein